MKQEQAAHILVLAWANQPDRVCYGAAGCPSCTVCGQLAVRRYALGGWAVFTGLALGLCGAAACICQNRAAIFARGIQRQGGMNIA